jgi:lipoyl(octanoyl) transferase
MMIPCQVLPYEVADGPANMALDEALLDVVAGGAGSAFLRTYGWSTPTLSLGYFQRLAAVLADPRWAGAPTVRRLSGGGAIWHHHEVTYALVVPGFHPLARPNTKLYRAVHAAIAEVLESFGVGAGLRGDDASQGHYERKRSLLCFTDTNAEDIVAKGTKIVGSAQRRREGAVLQHGSVLLRRSRFTPELAGVCDVADVSAEPRGWSDRLLERIPALLGLSPQVVNVADELRARARALEQGRYRDSEWTGIR